MEWYLKKEDGEIYGPVALQNLIHWSTEGRLAPGDQVSTDRTTWKPAPDQSELGMDWIVRLPGGEQYGPLHMMALAHLVDDGSIESHAKVDHKSSGESYVLSEALLGLLMDRNASLQASFDAINLQMLEMEAELQSYRDKAPRTAGAAPTGAGEELRRQLKELASRGDMLQKDTTKWKRLYEEERTASSRKIEQLNQRIEEMRHNDAQARSRLEEVSRRLRQMEQTHQTMMQAAEAAAGSQGAQALASQFGELMTAYNQLSVNYDKLFDQLSEKSREIQQLIGARRETEEHAEQRILEMEERMKREKEEADTARRAMIEMEESHHQLLKSYRDLNSRFIHLRQQAPATAAATAEPQPKKEDRKSSGSKGPRIRLTR